MTNIAATAKSVFLQAVDLSTPEERRKYLDGQCGHDPKLRDHVEALLCHHSAARDFLESPPEAIALAGHDVTAAVDSVGAGSGTMIGPYKLLEQIGEGGMGVVYVAEQTEPVRRRVALKIIKPGMDTQQVIARFEAERQALAMMDHPHIAKVLDAGTTDAGRPYFVMELVRGLPVTEYCDKARLSPRQRLELFIDVCHAVQHAHQKGVIHRDLKPSNVMITVHDGRPVAKVIDFGVAKAVGQQLTERTVYTAHTQLVGTPLYMSPEQADFSSQDVDTRSDVYSLGVMLYELLTGQTPFDKETLTKAGFDEMRRIIREDEPPCPSRRFSTLGAQAISTVSQHRSVDERHLGRVLRGELDWIVMKALEKDRSRRYESASALAADIQRYLSDEPVLACPLTTMYRFQKFARKHQSALATAAAIAACLLLGTTVSAWQAVRATTAEAQANANEQNAVANAAAAEQKEQEAVKQRDEVKSLAERLERTLYAAHMNLAQRAWDDAAVSRMHELLGLHRPKPGEGDRRGFEWHYLQRLSHREPALTLKGKNVLFIDSVVFSPDGTRAISATTGKKDEPEITVWNAHTGEELLSLHGHTKWISSVAISADGTLLASTSQDETVRVWDARTGRELRSLKGLVGSTASVAFSPDGKRLASAGEGQRNEGHPGEVKVWNTETGEELLSFRGSSRDTNSVAFSPDGKRLAYGIDAEVQDGSRLAGVVKVHDAETGQELFSLKGGGGSVAFSPDGKWLASRTGYGRERGILVKEEFKVWNTETQQEAPSLQERSDGSMLFAFSPNGKLLATAAQRSQTPSIKVSEIETGREIFSFHGRNAKFWTFAFSPDSHRLASTSEDGTLQVWDVQSGRNIRTLRSENLWIPGLAFSPDGKRLASAAYYDGAVRVWALENDSQSLTVNGGQTVISPDLSRLATAAYDNTIKVLDARSGQELISLKGHANNVLCFAFTTDGKRLASGDGKQLGPTQVPGVVKIWNVETGKELHSLVGHGRRVNSVAFSPDGKRVASRSSGSASGQPSDVRVWDAETGHQLFSLQGAYGPPFAVVTFSADGKLLAGGGRHQIKVWDVQTGQERRVLNDGGASVAFTSDCKRLAGVALDGTVRVWDLDSGREIISFKGGHLEYVLDLAFSPEGRRLASGSRDGVVKVWDVHTGQELLSLKGHTDNIAGVAFSPDGHRLASTSARDGSVKIYDATPLPEKQ